MENYYYVKVIEDRVVSKANPLPDQIESKEFVEVNKETYNTLTEFPYSFETDDNGNLINFVSKKEEAEPINYQPTETEMLMDYVVDVDFRVVMLELGL